MGGVGGWDDNLPWTCTHTTNTDLVGWVGWGWVGWQLVLDRQRQDKASNTHAAHVHEHRETHTHQKKQTQGKPHKSELVMNIKHVPVNQNRRHKRDKNRGTSETKTEAQARYLLNSLIIFFSVLANLLLYPCSPQLLLHFVQHDLILLQLLQQHVILHLVASLCSPSSLPLLTFFPILASVPCPWHIPSRACRPLCQAGAPALEKQYPKIAFCTRCLGQKAGEIYRWGDDVNGGL